VIVVDARGATRRGRSASGVRLHLISTGDRYDMAARRLEPDPAKCPLPRSTDTLEPPEDVFARWAFLHLLERFGRSARTELTVPVPGGSLVLRKGADFAAVSREGTGVEGTPVGLTLRGVLLDLHRR
jgi:hypothetical protein